MRLRRELQRFLLVGITTVAIDFAVYSLSLALKIDIDLAKAVGFLTGTLFAYFANRLWTFGTAGGWRIFLRFILLYSGTLAANVAANAIIIAMLGPGRAELIVSFVLATGLSAVLNFIGMKFLVFRVVPHGIPIADHSLLQ